MSSSFQQNMESNENVIKLNNYPVYPQQGGIKQENMNKRVNNPYGNNPGIINFNNINDDNNINNFIQNNIKSNKWPESKFEKKEYNTDKPKGIYKKNIIKKNLNNKSNQSNSNSNSDSISNVKAKTNKVNTVCWCKKNINSYNVLKNIKQKEILQNNLNKNDIHENKINHSNNQFNNNPNNIGQINIQSYNINNYNNANNQNSMQKNIIINENNDNQIKTSLVSSFQKNNQFQSNFNQTKILQSNINQNNINVFNINQNSQNVFNNQPNNINLNSINIINNNIQNQNQSNIQKNNQSNLDLNKNSSFNPNTFEIIQNNNQINKQLNVAVDKKSNQNKMNIKTSGVYTFSRYKKAAMTGLKNLENTSYLNSVLQLLCSIRNFSSYFLNPKNGAYFQNDLLKYGLSFVFHRLLTHIYPYPEKKGRELYKPDSFMFILGTSNSIYKDYKAKDPKMLIVYLLYKLHEELNDNKNKNNNFSNTNINIASNRDATINIGLQNITKSNNTIIFNYFNWFEIKEIKCMNCSNELFSFQNFSTFELDIYECARYKNLQFIKIEHCLDFYNITKIKRQFCHFCKSYNDATISTQIYSSPNDFIFLLNLENKLNDNDTVNFIIEKKINLGNYIENKLGPLKYELNGVVFFIKNRKKYVSLCCSPVDNRWYLYDDEKVELTDYEIFLQKEYDNGLNYLPCILLYKSSKN